MYNLHLSAEQLEIRDTVRDFVTREVKSVVLKADRLDACDRRSAHGVARQGLADGPAHAGARRGPRRRRRRSADFLYRDRGIGGRRRRHRRDARRNLAARAIFCFERTMTGAQRSRLLPQFADDDRCHLAFAQHEPDADTGLGVNYHRPIAAGSDDQDHGGEVGQWRLDRQRRQGLRRQRAGRRAVRRCGQDARAAERWLSSSCRRHAGPERACA